MLSVTGLTKTFQTPDGPLRVLDKVALSLPRNRSCALTGESGSGKSTLLHIIAGLEPADGGAVRLDGQRIEGLPDRQAAAIRRDMIGLVFQQFNLVPSLSVQANIDLQARLARAHDPDWSAHLVAALGLTDLTGRYPEQLSGGQQQRVAIARALAHRPGLLLADEPTGSLDAETGDAALSVMLSLVAETGATFLMVTHSDRLARRLDEAHRLHAGALTRWA